MIDLRLLAAIAASIAAPAAVARWWWRPRTLRSKLLDEAWLAVGAGALAARVAALALDDPMSFVSLRQFLQIRSGMEFWPGIATSMAVWGLEGRSQWIDPSDRLADLAPFALISYVVFEFSCLWRDGCFGPVSPIGLAPGGTGPAEIPVGVLAAAASLGLAGLVRRSHVAPFDRVVLAVAGLAIVRAVASLWLPSVSGGLTRQHLESLVVIAGAAALHVVRAVRRRRAAGVERAHDVPPHDTP